MAVPAASGSVATDTANLAHAVFPDTGYWAKEGTTTSADRRILRLDQAHDLRDALLVGGVAEVQANDDRRLRIGSCGGAF